jgi:Insect cuticle protein
MSNINIYQLTKMCENSIGITRFFSFVVQIPISYETKDNQLREEVGVLLNPGTPDEELVVMGKYSFVTPDETVHTVIYMADKNGYKPKVSQFSISRF